MLSNGHLRTYQIVVFLVSGTAGLVISIATGWTSRILRGQCVLYSHMAIKKTVNGSISVLMESSEWGTQFQCQFSTFCPVAITIYCIIWMWFYIFLSDWGTTFIASDQEKEDSEPDRPPPDQHLLIPSIACNLIVLGLLIATVAMIAAGRSVWCEHIIDVLKEPSCSFVGDVPWVNLKGGQDLYRYLKHATVACWVLLIAMVTQTVIMFIRLRRNSRRPNQLEESEEFDSDDDVILDPGHFDSASGESDTSSIKEVTTSTRHRKLHRQKHVVIVDVESTGSRDRLTSDMGVGLLDDPEYHEHPA